MAEALRPAKPSNAWRAFRYAGVGVGALGVMALAGCATPPMRTASTGNGRHYDSRLGVYASPRLVEDGEAVPRGGGTYLVGRPYTIAGRAYYPSERPDGYTVVGMASWYGDAFHGRRTANGEIFDKNSISAAHPTLPLPSYVRVTNTGNGRSMIVRVNDRGPYHGGRVMDVSQRVAEALNFKLAGTARIKVEYVGRAGLRGSDDDKLLATLRSDGSPAQMNGGSGEAMMASDDPPAAPFPLPPGPGPVAQIERQPRQEGDGIGDSMPERLPPRRRVAAPVPPQRPYDVSRASEIPQIESEPAHVRPAVAKLVPPTPPRRLVSFAPTEPEASTEVRFTPPRRLAPPPQDAQSEN